MKSRLDPSITALTKAVNGPTISQKMRDFGLFGLVWVCGGERRGNQREGLDEEEEDVRKERERWGGGGGGGVTAEEKENRKNRGRWWLV
jgi:hypothetical protein